MEIRWYKYARALSRVLQVRYSMHTKGPSYAPVWSEWADVPMAFENDEKELKNG